MKIGRGPREPGKADDGEHVGPALSVDAGMEPQPVLRGDEERGPGRVGGHGAGMGRARPSKSMKLDGSAGRSLAQPMDAGAARAAFASAHGAASQVRLDEERVLAEPRAIDLHVLHDALDVVARLGERDALDPVDRVDGRIARVAIGLHPIATRRGPAL